MGRGTVENLRIYRVSYKDGNSHTNSASLRYATRCHREALQSYMPCGFPYGCSNSSLVATRRDIIAKRYNSVSAVWLPLRVFEQLARYVLRRRKCSCRARNSLRLAFAGLAGSKTSGSWICSIQRRGRKRRGGLPGGGFDLRTRGCSRRRRHQIRRKCRSHWWGGSRHRERP